MARVEDELEELESEAPNSARRESDRSLRRSLYSAAPEEPISPRSPRNRQKTSDAQQLMANPEDQKRVQRLVSDVADLRREWDKLKVDFMSEREQMRDHVTSFESVVVNQVQTISQHTAQVLEDNKTQVKQEVENRRKEAADLLSVVQTMKLSVDRESLERMEQQEQVDADIKGTLERIEEVRKDFLTQISTHATNVDNILAALDTVKKALGQEQHERLVKYEQIDLTLEQFLGIRATLEAELKEHQQDAKELLSMMNAMSKKQDVDSYERIMHEEQVRNWVAETNEKVQTIRAEALGILGDAPQEGLEGGVDANATTASFGLGEDVSLRRRRPSRGASRLTDRAVRESSLERQLSVEQEPSEDRRSSLNLNAGLTAVTRQLHEERQERQRAIEDLQSRFDGMNHERGRFEVIPPELETLLRRMLAQEQKSWAQSKELLLRCREILVEERKQWTESGSAGPALDVPKLELRWKEMLAEERKQWSESSASPLEGRISRLEAALLSKAAPENDASGFATSVLEESKRMDILASELRAELTAHNARVVEIAEEGKLAKQLLEGEAKRAVQAKEACAQTTLALEKRVLGMQQRVEHEMQSLREAIGSLRKLIADNQRSPTQAAKQLQQQAASVDEDRLLAVQQRFEEELDKRTSDLQKKLADIDSQLVGQREAEDQDGSGRYAVLQQSLDTLIASLAQGAQTAGQPENDDCVDNKSTSSTDEAELRRVSKNEFHAQTQSLWSAVKQLQQSVDTPVEDQRETGSTSAVSSTTSADGRRALVASSVPGSQAGSTRAYPILAPGTAPAVTRSLSTPSSASGPSLVGVVPGSGSRTATPTNVASAYVMMGSPVTRARSSDSPSPFRQRPASATSLNGVQVGASSNSSAAYAQQRSQPLTPPGGYVRTPRSASSGLNSLSPLWPGR